MTNTLVCTTHYHISGYYRVNYDVTNWQLLANYLQSPQTFSKIAPTNRAQIVDDALTLARAGKLDYRIALNLTRYLVNEFEYVPWRSALGALNFIDSMMASGPDYYLFKVSYPVFLSLFFSMNKIGFSFLLCALAHAHRTTFSN